MTTIVVARKGRDIAIAADTMTKWGSGKETAGFVVNHGKLLQVGDTWLGLTGNATFKTILRDYFSRPKVRARFDTPLEIFRTWQALHVALKADYQLIATSHDDEPLESTRFDALIANRHGIFGVVSHRTVQSFPAITPSAAAVTMRWERCTRFMMTAASRQKRWRAVPLKPQLNSTMRPGCRSIRR